MSGTKGVVAAGVHDGWILGFDIGGTKTAVIVGTSAMSP